MDDRELTKEEIIENGVIMPIILDGIRKSQNCLLWYDSKLDSEISIKTGQI